MIGVRSIRVSVMKLSSGRGRNRSPLEGGLLFVGTQAQGLLCTGKETKAKKRCHSPVIRITRT